MAEVTSIHPADLRQIEKSLGTIGRELDLVNRGVDMVGSGVEQVNSNVKEIYDEVGKLANDFYDFVNTQKLANRLNQAEIRVVNIRQELEQKFGHYEVVRKTATGILQATDVGIVKRETIGNVTEELMLQTPNYWLTPCLIALAAWINDQPELAEKAVKEGIKRDDEKTSLFFGLICRRADRKSACLKWIQRYLENQDEENLDRKTVIILDAYAGGLLGADSEGVIAKQMTEWLEHLAEKPGFVEQQTTQWSEAINLKKEPLAQGSYTYLPRFSHTWPQIQEVLEGANLHAKILAYFTEIFDQETSNDSVKVQLDEILDSLVTDFDNEELPLRREERLEQYIIEFAGDEDRARRNITVEESAFEEKKDFTQLLTDSAMKPEISHATVSTQKFSIALSKEWISNAYNDITAQNRMKVPHEIEINVGGFNGKTTDGKNEQELIAEYNMVLDIEKASELKHHELSMFDDKFSLFGGGAIACIGLGMLVTGSIFMGLIAAIAGGGLMVNHFSKKKKNEEQRARLIEQFERTRTEGISIVRATLAEIVDFRSEFIEKDSVSSQVVDFLEQISPEQYVKKLSDSGRRIKVQ